MLEVVYIKFDLISGGSRISRITSRKVSFASACHSFHGGCTPVYTLAGVCVERGWRDGVCAQRGVWTGGVHPAMMANAVGGTHPSCLT